MNTGVIQSPVRVNKFVSKKKKTTPKDNYPHRKDIGHNLNCTPSLIGNRGEYFRVGGILEMVEKRGRYL